MSGERERTGECVWLWGRKEKIRDYGEKAFFITFKVVKICGKTGGLESLK